MAIKNILCVPDMHAPYQHPSTLKFLSILADTHKVDKVFCLGDELDQYTASQYHKSPDAFSGSEEYDKAMEFMEEFYELFPEGSSVTSNHMERVAKRASEAGIPRQYLRDVADFMQAPKGWKWADHWDYAGVRFEHGERAQGETGLRRLVTTNMMSTVVGHNHANPGTTYVSNGDKLLWGLNCGCLVNLTSVAFRYGRETRLKSVLGAGLILDGVPVFMPLEKVI